MCVLGREVAKKKLSWHGLKLCESFISMLWLGVDCLISGRKHVWCVGDLGGEMGLPFAGNGIEYLEFKLT